MTNLASDPNWQPPKPRGRPPKPKPYAPTRERVFSAEIIASKGKCKHRCPVGFPCCCDAEIRHDLHICPSETCGCHSESRYQADRAMRELRR